MPGSTELTKVDLPPGYNKNTTPYGAEGYYVSGDKVRFRYGKPETIGGWEQEILNRNVNGIARSSHAWRDLDNHPYRVFGTHKRLEVVDGGSLFDITPLTALTTITNAITVTSGGTTVIVSSAAHNAAVGDYVYFTSATTSFGGVTINNAEYEIVTVYSADSYGVSVTTTGALTTVGAGSATVNYIYSTGLVDNGVSFGYGVGTYGTYGASVCAGYGDPRGGSIGTKLRLWSLDNWGENLVACPQGGKIYQWDVSVGTSVRAQVVSAAPSINTFVLVAQPQRQLVAFGSHDSSGIFDPNLVRWSASENLTDWVASVGNNAGSYRLNSGSGIRGGVNTRGEILIVTDDTAFTMKFRGDALVYQFDSLGSKTDIVSQGAIVDVNGVAYWMGTNNFYRYDGVLSILPCSIHQYIFKEEFEGYLNISQKEKVVAGVNTDFDEIWWFYPDKNNMENNRYVVYNYVENIFYDGLITRTTWLDRGVYSNPQAVDAEGRLWTHEQGYNNGGSAMKKSLVTSEFDLSDGQKLMFVDRFVPDFEVEQSLNFEISTKKYPNSTPVTKTGYVITPTTTQIKFRARGRQASLRYSTSATDSFFRVGVPRIGVQPDGER